jgi:hypothetical protein
MILAVFGTIYAVCLFILAWTLFKAKPLLPVRPKRADEAAFHRVAGSGSHVAHGRDVIATHH